MVRVQTIYSLVYSHITIGREIPTRVRVEDKEATLGPWRLALKINLPLGRLYVLASPSRASRHPHPHPWCSGPLGLLCTRSPRHPLLLRPPRPVRSKSQ